MKFSPTILIGYLLATIGIAAAQQPVSRVKFFTDTAPINATLNVNMRNLLNKKAVEGFTFPATFSCKLNDSLDVNDQILVEVRGHFRRSYCYLPPMKLIFKKNARAALYHLKVLKLVSECKVANQYEQYVLKEFIAYKLYNLITDKSYRVRLLNLNYHDSSSRMKDITAPAYLIEDINEVAKRNGCDDWGDRTFATERTDRRQMTMVAIFEYMIGNTDWGVPDQHNVRLIHLNSDSISRPFVVPHDFDFSGFVNTNYSFPDEILDLGSVRQREYRGFPRTMEELKGVIDIFNKQKANIYATINNFKLLTPQSKKEMTSYLDKFFDTINRPADVKRIFINNARVR